jgi:transcriptional regulator with XRE-family HTH domain
MTELTVCPPDHKHGATSNCRSNHNCSCTPCRASYNAANARRYRLKAYGKWEGVSYISADPLRARLREFEAAGFTYRHVADAANVDPITLWRLLGGKNRANPTKLPARVHPITSARVLALAAPSIDTLSPHILVSPIPTVRRIHALMTLGWSQTRLAEKIGLSQADVSRLTRQTLVTVKSHRTIADLFEQLWNVEPPEVTTGDRVSVSKTKRLAAARGWLPPMAWDDIDTDPAPPTTSPVAHDDEDDAEQPEEPYIDEVLVANAMTGEDVHLSPHERAIAVARLNAQKISDYRIAEILHVDTRTVLRIRQRTGIPAALGADRTPTATTTVAA